jgi:hypothetical protein
VTYSRVESLTRAAKTHPSQPNHIIVPAAGDLVGNIPSLEGDTERANAVVQRILKTSGARRS